VKREKKWGSGEDFIIDGGESLLERKE